MILFQFYRRNSAYKICLCVVWETSTGKWQGIRKMLSTYKSWCLVLQPLQTFFCDELYSFNYIKKLFNHSSVYNEEQCLSIWLNWYHKILIFKSLLLRSSTDVVTDGFYNCNIFGLHVVKQEVMAIFESHDDDD